MDDWLEIADLKCEEDGIVAIIEQKSKEMHKNHETFYNEKISQLEDEEIQLHNEIKNITQM